MPFHVPSLKLTQQDGYLESCSLAVISEAYVHRQRMFDLKTQRALLQVDGLWCAYLHFAGSVVHSCC